MNGIYELNRPISMTLISHLQWTCFNFKFDWFDEISISHLLVADSWQELFVIIIFGHLIDCELFAPIISSDVYIRKISQVTHDATLQSFIHINDCIWIISYEQQPTIIHYLKSTGWLTSKCMGNSNARDIWGAIIGIQWFLYNIWYCYNTTRIVYIIIIHLRRTSSMIMIWPLTIININSRSDYYY